jgi:hypothetical protein
MKDPAPFFFGIVSIAVGIGVGFLMYAFPEGLNRNWPIWMAMLAPASFVLAGLRVRCLRRVRRAHQFFHEK